MNTTTKIITEAENFLRDCYNELGKSNEQLKARLKEVREEIEKTGYYQHTFEELEHGAKMAWRNNNRCIGRLFWNSLHVFDYRELKTEEEIANACFKHICYSTNEGRIIPTISIFKPKQQDNQIRIWNYQLLRYAGYETEDGTIGDPSSIELTKLCETLGWQGERTHFDILPIVIQMNNQPPKWFSIPKEIVLEVDIRHPEITAIADLQLKWYAVPIVSEMKLEIGGMDYTAAPFNGWYMGTEIGARNLADETRYNMLPKIASKMGLNTTRESTLWKDKALVELNVAVLHSFKEDSVSIVDHHTAANQFKHFEIEEQKSGREVTGNWSWLIPPVSPAATHIFHQPYKNKIIKPNYFYQTKPSYKTIN